ncbi:MAG: hypothetical protein N2Z57_02940, partial [Oscillospiraceae bacterium]|nr:hypothetical protein [Oscillospiraceae bacterium]
MTVFEEFKRRGLIAQMTHEKEIEELLNGKGVTFYIGFDATADSLHAGHFLQLVVMSRLQKAGHIVYSGQLVELYWEGDVKGPSSFVEVDIKDLLIYEHKDFLVLNKPAGVPSQATLTSSKDTILHVLNKKNTQKYPLNSFDICLSLDDGKDNDVSPSVTIRFYANRGNNFIS